MAHPRCTLVALLKLTRGIQYAGRCVQRVVARHRVSSSDFDGGSSALDHIPSPQGRFKLARSSSQDQFAKNGLNVDIECEFWP